MKIPATVFSIKHIQQRIKDVHGSEWPKYALYEFAF